MTSQNKELYNVEIYVDGARNEALTSSFRSFTVRTSIDFRYPLVQVLFHCDSQEVIQNNAFPNSVIGVKIDYTSQTGESTTSYRYDLAIMSIRLELPPKVGDNITNPRDSQRRVCEMSCHPIESIQRAFTAVNRLFERGCNVTPIEVIKYLLKDSGCKRYEVDNVLAKNAIQIDQLIIPPMNLIDAVDYVLQYYPPYPNKTLRFFDMTGKFVLCDMVSKYNNNAGTLTFHKLPSYSPDSEVFQTASELCLKDNTHHIISTIESVSKSNDNIVSNGFNFNFINHPDDDIVDVVKLRITDDIIENNCVVPNPIVKDLKMNRTFLNNMVYKSDQMGCYKSQYNRDIYPNAFTRYLSDSMFDCNLIKFDVARDIRIDNFMTPGIPIDIKVYSEHETLAGTSYEGKYILIRSDLTVTNFYGGNQQSQIRAFSSIVAGRTVQSS